MPRTSARSAAVHNQSPTTVGERILQARLRLGMTQRDLAAPNLTASYISHIESNKSRPSLKTLAILAERLGKPVSVFLEGDAGVAQSHAPSLAAAYTLYATADYHGCYDVLSRLPSREGANHRTDISVLLGKAARRAGLTNEAVAALVEARRAAKDVNQLDLYWALAIELSLAYEQQDQTVTAKQLAADAYAAIRATVVRDPLVCAAILARWAYYEPQADLSAALPYTAEFLAAAYLSLLDDTTGKDALMALYVLSHANSAVAEFQVGVAEITHDTDRSSHLYAEALSHYRWAGDVSGTTSVLCRLAELALHNNQLDAAQSYADEADMLAQRCADARVQTETLLVRAEIAAAHTDSATAESCYSDAVARADESKDPELQRRTRLSYAESLHKWGQTERAVHALIAGARLVSA